jgi:hypothetical protein
MGVPPLLLLLLLLVVMMSTKAIGTHAPAYRTAGIAAAAVGSRPQLPSELGPGHGSGMVLSYPSAEVTAAAAAGAAPPKRAAFFAQQPPATIEDAYRLVKSGTAAMGGFAPFYQDYPYPYQQQQQQQQQQPESRRALLNKLLAVRANWRPGVIISDRVAASTYNKAAAMSRAAAALAATSAYAAARAKAYAEGRWAYGFTNFSCDGPSGVGAGGGGCQHC